jgi:predicted PhzF superfamily epimerase YddE/YHI9
MASLHVLRVFSNDEGEWGNHLGVFVDGSEVPAARRQVVAGDLGFAETVFVDDAKRGDLRIFTPATELPFAGHPLVGTGWLLGAEGEAPPALPPPAGEVGLRADPAGAAITARPEWAPPFEQVELSSPAEVHALPGPPIEADGVYAWAWIDEAAGTIRARSFAAGYGVPEDEATGSAALALCARLARPVTIHQGRGSVLNARPLEDGRVEVGGRVARDEVRDYRVLG